MRGGMAVLRVEVRGCVGVAYGERPSSSPKGDSSPIAGGSPTELRRDANASGSQYRDAQGAGPTDKRTFVLIGCLSVRSAFGSRKRPHLRQPELTARDFRHLL